MKRIFFIFAMMIFITELISIDYYHLTPDWQSIEQSQYSTGCAVADINGDGLNDLITADGNDMDRQTVKVYFNSETGIENTASWQSSDIDYHGQLTVGDVTGNGYPDVIEAD